MIWPFRKSNPLAPTIAAIYGMIVAQARMPQFYQAFEVPDTVNGRFDMVVLHLWVVLRRLRAEGPQAQQLAQGLFDHFCSDMDDNLREMGTGDLAVPRRMRAFGEAFYGRATAYDAALADADPDGLAKALGRNILGMLPEDAISRSSAHDLADYVRVTLAQFAACPSEELVTGAWQFPAPKELAKAS